MPGTGFRTVASAGLITHRARRRSCCATDSETRPSSSSSSSAPTSSRRQPRRVRTSASLAADAPGGDDRLQVGARGEQLVGETGLAGARPHEGLREGDQGPSPGAGAGGRPVLGSGSGGVRSRGARHRATRARGDAGWPRRRRESAPADCRGRLALGELDQRGVAEDALHRPVRGGGRVLAPLHQLAGDRLRGGAQAANAGQAREHRVEVALVAERSRKRHSSRAHSRRPSAARRRSSSAASSSRWTTSSRA